jgi:hypothetical protein
VDFDVGKDLADIVMLTLIVDRMAEDAVESYAHCAVFDELFARGNFLSRHDIGKTYARFLAPGWPFKTARLPT